MADWRPNATAASLLGFLQEGPLTGWDLVRTAQARIGEFWTLTQSQVYRELGAMAAHGLVEAGARGSRDRRPYAITEAGRAAFREWLTQMPPEESIRFPLLLTISFGRWMEPATLHRAVHAQRQVHAQRLAAYRADHDRMVREQPEAIPWGLATLTFGLAYEAAALAWFDRLPPEIRGLGLWQHVSSDNASDDAALGS